jgi:hypothetical protein
MPCLTCGAVDAGLGTKAVPKSGNILLRMTHDMEGKTAAKAMTTTS